MRQRLGQGAGLVEYHRVGFGQPLQRRRGFQKHARAQQAGGGDDLHGGHGQRQGTGAGDDQDRARGQQRLIQGDAGAEIPTQKRQQRGRVNHGGVSPCHPVGQDHVARAAGLGCLHHPDAAGQQRRLANRRDTDNQRLAQIDRAREDRGAGNRGPRQALAGDQGGVQRRLSGFDGTVDADTLPTANQHPVARLNRLLRSGFNRAIGRQDLDHANPPGQELFRQKTGTAARVVVQNPADQQKEQQRDRGIEIGMLGVPDGLAQADGTDKYDTQADGHIHVGAAMTQRGGGGREERAPGIGDRGQRDQRRHPVQKIACRRPHVRQPPRGLGRPNADGQQHDVDGGEARDGEGTDQVSLRRVPGNTQAVCRERDQAISQALHDGDQPPGILGRAAPDEFQAAGGQVDPGRGHRGIADQHRFDQPDTGAALQPIHGHRQFPGAVGSRRADTWRQGVLCYVWPWWPDIGIEQPLAVVPAQAKFLDQIERGGTAMTAEPLTLIGYLTAMRAGPDRRHGRTKRARGGERRHRTMTRLVTA